MRKPVLNQQRALAVVAGLALVISLLPARLARLVSGYPRHLLAATLAPADHVLKPLADSLRRPPDLPVDLGNREEYERATQQIFELQYKLSQANQRIAELSQIRNTFRLTGVGLLSATVTAWSANPSHPTLTVNRGSTHGLRTGLVVVRGFSLVGTITDAGPVTATVGLITATKNHLVVRIKPPASDSQPRQLTIQAHTAKTRDCFWASIGQDDPVQEGDLAHLNDDTWPPQARGFVVGTVTKIEKHPDDPILRRRLTITPIRSLAHLDAVTVIVPASPPDADLPHSETDQQIPTTRP